MSETTSVYQAYQGNTYLFGGNAPYVEEMYENYLANPGSVPDSWREYFDALQHVPAVDGSPVAVRADSICVHGDSPGAVAMARAVRERLQDAGVAIRPFCAALA